MSDRRPTSGGYRQRPVHDPRPVDGAEVRKHAGRVECHRGRKGASRNANLSKCRRRLVRRHRVVHSVRRFPLHDIAGLDGGLDVGRSYKPVDHRRARRGRWRAAGSAGATAPGQRGYEREQGKRHGLAGPILLEQVHGDATRPAPGLFPETRGTGGVTQARKVVRRRNAMARKQRRNATAPNSRTMSLALTEHVTRSDDSADRHRTPRTSRFAQASLHFGGNNRCAGPVTPPDAVPTWSAVSYAIEVSGEECASSTDEPW